MHNINLPHWFGVASFYVIAVGILITAYLTVIMQNLFRAAIFLAITLIGVAGIYFLLHAEFLAAVQILLYVGAIMTLVIFAIMLTSKIGDPGSVQTNRQRYTGLVLIIVLGVSLISILWKTPWNVLKTPQATNAVELGKALMGNFVFPFEVVSVVLLIALVGAIAISRSDE